MMNNEYRGYFYCNNITFPQKKKILAENHGDHVTLQKVVRIVYFACRTSLHYSRLTYLTFAKVT